MTRKTNTPTQITPYTIDQFADRVNVLHSAVLHGDNPNPAAVKVRDAWRSLDPILTVRGTEAQDRATRLGVALGRAADIAGQVPKKTRWSVGNFRTSLRLDQADAMLRSPAEANPARTLEAILGGIDLAHERPGKKVESAFDALSARAMLLHLESKKNAESQSEPWRRYGAEAILRASLGKLIQDSVSTLSGMHTDFLTAQSRGGDGSHLTGRLVETMYFTYRLMGWYRNEGSLASGYTRFAVFREDKPMFTPSPRRSFDVAVISAMSEVQPELVQVKATHNAGYAEGITVWRPRQQGIINEATQVINWFNTLVANETSESDMAAAWRNLQFRFEDPKMSTAGQ